MDPLELLLENDEISDYAQRRLASFLASHHGAPITMYPQRHVIRILENENVPERTVLLDAYAQAAIDFRNQYEKPIKISDNPATVYYYCLSEAIATGHGAGYKTSQKRVRDCLLVTRDDVEWDLKAVRESHPAFVGPGRSDLPDDAQMNFCAMRLSRAHHMKMILEDTRNQIQRAKLEQNEKLIPVYEDEGIKITTVREMALVIIKKVDAKKAIYVNYDQILMMHDTVCCRWMVRLSLEINSMGLNDNLPPWDVIYRVYKWGDDLICNYGVNAYATLGEFESILTGLFVNFSGADPLNLGSEFMSAISDTARENEVTYGVPQSETLRLIEMLREISSVNWLSEIFGLRKHWGNPVVDAKASGRAVLDKVDEVLPVDGSALIRLHASFVRMIVTNFIKQNGRWPEGEFLTDNVNVPIFQAYKNKICKLPETSPNHKHEHWALFKFLPNCVIDAFKDDLKMISDKSVSVYRPHLDSIYVRALCKVEVPRNIPENRRLILEYIRTKHVSILDIFRAVMTKNIPNDWLANSASMKGTEMKHEKARIFAVLTYEIRQYFTATEELIKDHVFKYNPHQTMTMSETELLTKLRSLTKQMDPGSDSRFLSVMHIVDFSKWNLRMRYRNTSSVFKAIDDFLGTPGLVEQSHFIFSDMVNVVQDSFNPPPDGVLHTESDTIWCNHHCGWEGQRQKGWTVLTSAVLSDLARITGVSSLICGQGDNQTLLTQFPVPSGFLNPYDWIKREPKSVRRVIDNFYSLLERECLSIGLKIKTAETCRSLSYLNYGKRLYMHGCEMSMTLKRISKNITEPNDTYPTSEAILKTLEGSSYAAGLYSHPSILPFFISRFVLVNQLMSSFSRNQLVKDTGLMLLEKDNVKLSRKFLSTLIKIPSSLGGPPQYSFAASLYRGHPDPLCCELVMVVLKAKAGCVTSSKILACALSGKWFNKFRESKEALINSPYSLNLNIPTSSRIPLEREILPALKTQCKNPVIKELFSSRMDTTQKDIVDILSTMKPFHPLVANDIYSRTLPGRRQAFLSGLSNTTSLGRLIYENHFDPLVRKVCNFEAQQLQFWISRVIQTSNEPPLQIGDIHPHHIIAQRLRDDSWNGDIFGVTVPHPLEQFSLCNSVYGMCSHNCRQLEKEHLIVVRHNEDLVSLPGVDSEHITSKRSRRGSPYLGSSVAEGMTQKAVKCINPDENWRDVIRLNTVKQWVCDRGSELCHFLNEVISSRTDVDESTLDLATGIPSRLSYNHRARLMSVINDCGLTTTSNMYTRLYLSSDKMGQYSHGDNNYHMAFGPTFLCLQALLCLNGVYVESDWSLRERTVYHAHVREASVPVVYDGRLTVYGRSKNVQTKDPPSILFTSKSELCFESLPGWDIGNVWDSFEKASHTDARMAYAAQLVGDSFVRETIVRESITQIVHETVVSRGISVSIGDVSIVGVRNLIRTLGWQTLILSPNSLWECDRLSTFSVRAHQLVSTFSNDFWTQFTGCLSNSRLFSDLTRNYPRYINFTCRRTVSGLVPLMKCMVIEEMYTLLTELRNSFSFPGQFSPVPLISPSFNSVLFSTAKYVEMSVFCALSGHGVGVRESKARSLDFSANMFTACPETYRLVLSRIMSDIHIVCAELDIPKIFIPVPKIYSMQHPWIDKLRKIQKPSPSKAKTVEALSLPSVHLKPIQHSIMIGDDSIMIPISDCDCKGRERMTLNHSEFFFMPTGRLSKSHFKFLHLASYYRLDITGVACLGSESGSEAYSFALADTCKTVYISSGLKITQFSPHLAGDYSPPLFKESTTADKLVCSCASVLDTTNILSRDSLEPICAHLKDHIITGITCDEPIKSINEVVNCKNLIENLCCLVARLESCAWLIVRLPIFCSHVAKRYISMLGEAFGKVTIAVSPFSAPRTNLVYLICSNRKSSFIGVHRHANSLPLELVDDTDVMNVIEKHDRFRFCSLFYETHKSIEVILQLANFNEDSFQSTLRLLIPGMQSSDLNKDRQFFRDSLKLVKSKMENHARELLAIFVRTHESVQSPRHHILQLDMKPFHKKLESVYTVVNRCELMLSLTESEEFIPDVADQTLQAWMIKEHRYQMKNRDFTLTIDETTFIRTVSKLIWEILGHIYQHKSGKLTQLLTARSFHLDKIDDPIPSRIEEIFQCLPTTSVRQEINKSWYWNRRAMILFWLMAAHLTDSTIWICTNLDFLLEQLKAESVIFKNRVPISRNQAAVYVSKVDSTVDLDCLANDTFGSFFLLVKIHLCPILPYYFQVEGFIKCPWTGTCPSEAIAICTKRTDLSSQLPRCDFPDFDRVSRLEFPEGFCFFNCGCWDCTAEHLLLNQMNLTHSKIDEMCSLRKIETVRSTVHLL